jgi:sodium/proline symporter
MTGLTMTQPNPVAVAVFFATLMVTFAVAIYARGRAHSGSSEEDLAGRSLNKWMVGLSAGTTGNSGFIVTAAVGLGYSGGAKWLLLPLGWLLGDLVYWSLFPDKINARAREAKAVTLSELLIHDLGGPAARLISISVALILVVFLSIYTSAQWLAGEKFLSGVFEITPLFALLGFGLVIIVYSAIGGFRGSVYVDTLQAVIRIGGTILALAVVITHARADPAAFSDNIAAAGPDFLNPLMNGGLLASAAFMLGFAGAAIGFGLGQPQIVSRYMAGDNPTETKAAWWIYIGFLQSTWIAMTVFGIILRGVQPNIIDPETGLSLFFQTSVGVVATGIIFADVFATIASTSNGLLVAISQVLRRDLLGQILKDRQHSLWVMSASILCLGLVTVALSLVLPGNVFSLAVAAVSQIGAGLAGAVMIKVFDWRHTSCSLLASIIAGAASGAIWALAGLGAWMNEAAIGIVASLAINRLLSGGYAARVTAMHGSSLEN